MDISWFMILGRKKYFVIRQRPIDGVVRCQLTIDGATCVKMGVYDRNMQESY